MVGSPMHSYSCAVLRIYTRRRRSGERLPPDLLSDVMTTLIATPIMLPSVVQVVKRLG